MASLTEVYQGGAGGADLRRLYVGVGLFVVGAALTVAGIVFGTSTGAATAVGLSVPYGAREIGGILAGVGLPVTFLGATTVLPRASLRLRGAAVLGAAVSLAGVAWFTAVYPGNWYGMTPDYTLPVTFVYFLGAMTTLWCLFVAVANFKARNDPGGTVRLEITKEGKTRVVEVSNDRLRQGLGGIGLLGNTPDGNVETQTNDADSSTATRSDGGTVSGANRASSGAQASDGGTAAHPAGGSAGPERPAPSETHDAEVMRDEPTPRGDVYCGNCAHFQYVRTEEGLEPYCGLHAEAMDDMEACAQWERN